MQSNQRWFIRNGRVILETRCETHIELISRIDGKGGVTRIEAVIDQENYAFTWMAQKTLEGGTTGMITVGYGKSVSDAYNKALEYVASCHSMEVQSV